MRMTSAQLKLAARQCLRGKYGSSVLMLFVFYVAVFIIQIPYQIINMLGSIFLQTEQHLTGIALIVILVVYYIPMNLVISTLSAGMSWYFYRMTSGQPYEIRDLIYFFTHGVVKFSGIYGLFFLISTGPVILAAVIGIGCVAGYHADIISIVPAIAVISISMLAAVVISYIVCHRYALIYYIYGENREMKVTWVLKESARLMKGNKRRSFWLGLSFMGMFVLGMMSFCIGYLWILPYFLCTWSQLYINIKEEKASEHYPYL